MKWLYFLVDATHPGFEAGRAVAIQRLNDFLPFRKNDILVTYSPDGTEAALRLCGTDEDWFEASPWNGHPIVKKVYAKDDERYEPFENYYNMLYGYDGWYPEIFPPGSPIEIYEGSPIDGN